MQESESKATIEIMPNGPLIIKACSEIHDSSGSALESKAVVALCRCGASANKTYCDGTHSEIGFTGVREIDKPLAAAEDVILPPRLLPPARIGKPLASSAAVLMAERTVAMRMGAGLGALRPCSMYGN